MLRCLKSSASTSAKLTCRPSIALTTRCTCFTIAALGPAGSLRAASAATVFAAARFPFWIRFFILPCSSR
jgi:hypothetical protein